MFPFQWPCILNLLNTHILILYLLSLFSPHVCIDCSAITGKKKTNHGALYSGNKHTAECYLRGLHSSLLFLKHEPERPWLSGWISWHQNYPSQLPLHVKGTHYILLIGDVNKGLIWSWIPIFYYLTFSLELRVVALAEEETFFLNLLFLIYYFYFLKILFNFGCIGSPLLGAGFL